MHTTLHVGAHKTGTSLIQWYFRENLDELEQLGIRHVRRTRMKHLVGSGPLVEEEPERLRGRLEELMAAGGVGIMLSHEDMLGRPFVEGEPGLYPRAGRFGRAIRSACEGLDLSVVLYVRPLESFIESYYVQTVQQGGTQTFEEWYGGLDESAISWEPMVAALDEAIGPGRVVLGDFTEIREGQSEFLRRFMQRARLPVPEDLSYEPVKNASVSSRGLEMARSVNPLVARGAEHKATRRFLQRHFSNQTEDRARPMPDAVRDRLQARRGAEYERLAARARRDLAAAGAARVEGAR